MKFLCLILLMLTLNAYAKRDVDMRSFNAAMIKTIDTTIKNNPQVYEKGKVIMRGPASVGPSVNEVEQLQERSEKLQDFHEQMTQGSDQW